MFQMFWGRRNISTDEQVEHEALMSACSAQSVRKTLHLSCRRSEARRETCFIFRFKNKTKKKNAP